MKDGRKCYFRSAITLLTQIYLDIFKRTSCISVNIDRLACVIQRTCQIFEAIVIKMVD